LEAIETVRNSNFPNPKSFGSTVNNKAQTYFNMIGIENNFKSSGNQNFDRAVMVDPIFESSAQSFHNPTIIQIIDNEEKYLELIQENLKNDIYKDKELIKILEELISTKVGNELNKSFKGLEKIKKKFNKLDADIDEVKDAVILLSKKYVELEERISFNEQRSNQDRRKLEKISDILETRITEFNKMLNYNPLFEKSEYHKKLELASEAMHLRDESLVLINKGELDLAENKLRKAIDLDPYDPFTWNYMGDVFNEKGEIINALLAYDHAIENQPPYTNAHNNKGYILYGLGQFDEALREFNICTINNPFDSVAWYHKGLALCGKGGINALVDADKAFEKAFGLDPDNLNICEWLIEVNTILGTPRNKDKVNYYRRKANEIEQRIRLNQWEISSSEEQIPQHAPSTSLEDKIDKPELKEKSIDFFNKGDYISTIHTCDKILEVDSKDPGVWNVKGLANRNLGNLDEAIKCYRTAIKNSSTEGDKAMPYNNMGVAQSKKGDDWEAIECFRNSIDRKPEYPYPWNNKGNAEFRRGQKERAVGDYHHALILNPNISEIHYNLGRALVIKGENKEALDNLEEAVRLDPDYIKAWHYKSVALFNLKEYEKAADCVDKIKKIDPGYEGHKRNFAVILNKRGKQLSNLGKYSEAIEHCRRAINIDPTYSNARRTIGKIANQATGTTHKNHDIPMYR